MQRGDSDPDFVEAVARGALTDEQLAPGIRSVAAPLRDGDGRVVAAVTVTVHAAETSLDTLLGSSRSARAVPARPPDLTAVPPGRRAAPGD